MIEFAEDSHKHIKMSFAWMTTLRLQAASVGGRQEEEEHGKHGKHEKHGKHLERRRWSRLVSFDVVAASHNNITQWFDEQKHSDR
jgi:hypothetical protein